MNNDIHVMVDLETTGTSPGCCILSIGATTFNTGTPPIQFYSRISYQSSQDHGFTTDPNTLRWWKEQSKEAYDEAFGGKEHIKDALQAFSTYLAGLGGTVHLWGNGAAFDNVILASAYDQLHMKTPWEFRYDRCYRTLKGILPYVKALPFEGTKHNALADAVHQAKHAEALLGWIERFKKL